MVIQDAFAIKTKGYGLIDITERINALIKKNSTLQDSGLVNIFLHHTSASLIICENASLDVLDDLEHFMQKLVNFDENNFKHTLEGKDDMPAHIRSILTGSQLNIPILHKTLDLGIWQGVFLWEHRKNAHIRKITCSVLF